MRKKNGVEPFMYLCDLIALIPEHKANWLSDCCRSAGSP